MTVLGIMKNLFKKKFRVYRDDLKKLMQSISIEKVKDVLKNGPRELKESVQKSLEKTSEKKWNKVYCLYAITFLLGRVKI